MITHPSSLVGYGGYTAEQHQMIVRRAHMQRLQAMREFFTWLFARRKAAARRAGQAAHRDAMTCG
jgi:hypothetical protein